MGVHEAGGRDRPSCAMAIEAEVIDKRNLQGTADIPACRSRTGLDAEYRDFPEEKIWSPKEEVNDWVSLYVFMARSVLTFVQESQGISNRDAMENSCTGYAEQYITDVLHDSEYIPEVALKTLLTKELPQKLVARWTASDIELFIQGMARHGKNFASIQKNLLPRKDTKDIVDFYYAWKWSEPAKRLRSCRRRRRPNSKRRFPSIACIFGELSSPKIVTRSATAASRHSHEKKTNERILKSANSAESSKKSSPKRRLYGSLVGR